MITASAFMALAGLGALMRAVAGKRWNRHDGFAFGTLAVNLVGSFSLGLLYELTPPLATVLGAGFLGALTTFSSFVRDAVALVELRRTALAFVYLMVTLAGCMVAALAGVAIT